MDIGFQIAITLLAAVALFALVRYTRVGDWIIAWILADYGLPPTRLSFVEQAGFVLAWTLLVSVHSLLLHLFLPTKTAAMMQCVIVVATIYISTWYIRHRFPEKNAD